MVAVHAALRRANVPVRPWGVRAIAQTAVPRRTTKGNERGRPSYTEARIRHRKPTTPLALVVLRDLTGLIDRLDRLSGQQIIGSSLPSRQEADRASGPTLANTPLMWENDPARHNNGGESRRVCTAHHLSARTNWLCFARPRSPSHRSRPPSIGFVSRRTPGQGRRGGRRGNHLTPSLVPQVPTPINWLCFAQSP